MSPPTTRSPSPSKRSPQRRKATKSRTTRRSRSRKKPPARRYAIWQWLGLAVLIVLGYLGFKLLQLDHIVRTRFYAPVEHAPAHIYSRPYTVQRGSPISTQTLIAALKQRGYKLSKSLSEPGQFVQASNVLDIWLKAGGVWNQRAAPRAVRVLFQAGQVERLLDHRSGQPLEQLALAPELLGNMQAGPSKDRLPLKLHDAPDFLLTALIAMEDRRFEQHIGVDPKGILRALWNNLRGGSAQGASTLTQQLVKNIYLSPERTLSRKAKEAVMSLLVELHFSKAAILERYLNEIFLGQSGHRAIHGFRLAAQFYFSKPLNELNEGEIATLVGLIPAPSAYNPHRHPGRARKRRNLVLSTLVSNGKMSQEMAHKHQQFPLNAHQGSSKKPRYHDFIDLINQQLEQEYASVYVNTRGHALHTTLDPHIQNTAEAALSRTLSTLEQQQGLTADTLEGAIVVIEPGSGEVRAVVGSRYPRRAGFNRALDARRPIGSLVKPAVFLTALSQPERYSLVTPLDDSPIRVPQPNKPDWQPLNYDSETHPDATLHSSLIHSYNVATVRLGMDVGLGAVQSTLQRLGQEKPPHYPSLLLGAYNASPYDMAQMYQAIANGGHLMPLRSLNSIAQQNGDLIAQFTDRGTQVVDPAANYLLNASLREVTQSGTGRALQSLLPGKTVAGKTGTTDDFRDSWFAGYAKDLLAVVWVGNDNNQPIRLSGSAGALRVWAALMQQLGVQSLPQAVPLAQVVEVNIDLDNGELAVAGCSERSAVLPFIRGHEPVANSRCNAVKDRFSRWIQNWWTSEPQPSRPTVPSGSVTRPETQPSKKPSVFDDFETEFNLER